MTARGELFELGTTYQPDEAPLPLTVNDLCALGEMLEGAGGLPHSIQSERFVVEPVARERRSRSRGDRQT
jgi:hypothetical protein